MLMIKSQGKSAHRCQHQRDVNESIVPHINKRAYRIERSHGACHTRAHVHTRTYTRAHARALLVWHIYIYDPGLHLHVVSIVAVKLDWLAVEQDVPAGSRHDPQTEPNLNAVPNLRAAAAVCRKHGQGVQLGRGCVPRSSFWHGERWNADHAGGGSVRVLFVNSTAWRRTCRQVPAQFELHRPARVAATTTVCSGGSGTTACVHDHDRHVNFAGWCWSVASCAKRRHRHALDVWCACFRQHVQRHFAEEAAVLVKVVTCIIILSHHNCARQEPLPTATECNLERTL